MKMLLLTGTVIGFLLGIALGLAGRSEWPTTFLHATAAAIALGLLMRWWGGVCLRGLWASHEQRRLAEAVARQKANSTSTQKK
jgi:hypothetical protein